MKKKMILGAAIIVIVGGAILGYSLIKKGKSEEVKYRTETLAKGDIESLVVTSGTINPVDIIEIGSQVSGKIVKLHADFNSMVKAGQIVAELDQEILKSKVEQNQANYQSRLASLEQAKVTLDNAKKKNQRSKDLFARELIPLEEKEAAEAAEIGAKVGLQNAEANVSTAKSQLDSSKVDLSYAIIRSPIDGMVITRSVNVGQTVAASMSAPVLFKVASDLAKMQVQCAVDEADIGRVKEKQKVRFTVDAFQGEVFSGEIRQVRNSPTTAQNVVTYQTIIDAANPDLKLRPGMTATVSIITGEARGVLKVSNSALRFTPPLPKEQMDKLLADARGSMGQRGPGGQPGETGQAGQPSGGQPQTQPQGEGQRTGGERGQRGGQGGQRFDMSQLTPEQLQRFQQRMSQRRASSGTVWVMDDLGGFKPYFVGIGITDNTFTEITRGELKEGMKVVLGTSSASQTTTTQQQMMRGGPGGPGGMMFIGR
jgi:HlyD family secretion protein